MFHGLVSDLLAFYDINLPFVSQVVNEPIILKLIVLGRIVSYILGIILNYIYKYIIVMFSS
mgnify:FL=1